MREIKFRGKTKRGTWIYGNLGSYRNTFRGKLIDVKNVIFQDVYNFQTDNFGYVVENYAVLKDTIGQYTGLKDKNGKEIYEGDIVIQKGYYGNKKAMLVRFECGAFIVGYHCGSSTRTRPMLISNKCEVIGNIYDNKTLLK